MDLTDQSTIDQFNLKDTAKHERPIASGSCLGATVRRINEFWVCYSKIPSGAKGAGLLVTAPPSGPDQGFLTEVVVLIEMKFIVDAPHTELLAIGPAGTPVHTHTQV